MNLISSYPLILIALLPACATAPTQPEAPLTPYVCDGTLNNLTADYYSLGRPRVVLNLEGDAKTLYSVPSASGTRYTNARNGTSKPGTFIWWTKGSEAILYQVATRPDGYLYEQQLATCTSNPQPLAAPSQLQLTPESTNLPGTIPGTAPRLTTNPVTI